MIAECDTCYDYGQNSAYGRALAYEPAGEADNAYEGRALSSSGVTDVTVDMCIITGNRALLVSAWCQRPEPMPLLWHAQPQTRVRGAVSTESLCWTLSDSSSYVCAGRRRFHDWRYRCFSVDRHH